MRRMALVTTMALAGCTELAGPSIQRVEILQGDDVVAEKVVSLSDTIEFEDRVPVDATFTVVFSEPVEWPSARRNIDAEDEDLQAIALEIGRDEERVLIDPVEGEWQDGTRFTIYVDAGIEDEQGQTTTSALSIEFETEREE